MGNQSGLPVYENGYTGLPDKNWNGLPTVECPYMDPALKKKITMYGEAAQATYDTVDLRAWSRYRDQNRYVREKMLDGPGKTLDDPEKMLDDPRKMLDDLRKMLDGQGKKLDDPEKTLDDLRKMLEDPEKTLDDKSHHLRNLSHFAELPGQGYAVVKDGYMRASENAEITEKLRQKGQKQTKHVWIGYVAYSEKRKDILVAWRGTQRPAEWIADATLDQIEYVPYRTPSKPKLGIFAKFRPLLTAVAWASPLLLFLGVKKAPSRLPPDLVSFVADFEGQLRATASGFLAKAAAVLWAAIPVVSSRFRHSVLAGGAATVLGILPLTLPAGVIYVIGRLLPTSFQAGGAVTVLATFPLAFLAAIPVLDLFNIRGKWWWIGYAAAASFGTGWWSTRYPGDFYQAILALGLAVFLPLAITAGQAAWAGATVKGPCVHEGFFELYTRKLVEKNGAVKGAPRDVLHEAVQNLLARHTDCQSISVSGHSLGAALAVLSAFDLVKSGTNKCSGRDVPVTCYSFEGPRVGNLKFVDEFNELEKLSAIRIVNKPDIVTQVPKALFLQNVYYCVGATFNWYKPVCALINWFEYVSYAFRLPSAYKHVGVEVTMDSRQIDYIQKMTSHINPFANITQISTYHNLESALHVLSGFSEHPKTCGETFDRDFALINKVGDCLDPRCGISPNWLDTLRPNVVKSDEGALIQPYDPDRIDEERFDEQRRIGWGPGVASQPLSKCYPLDQ